MDKVTKLLNLYITALYDALYYSIITSTLYLYSFPRSHNEHNDGDGGFNYRQYNVRETGVRETTKLWIPFT